MKVLMTADTVGGVWTYAIELARALRPHGVEIILATMGARPSGEQRREAIECGNIELCESDYALEWMHDPWSDVDAASEWLLDLAAAHAPDLAHLNGYAHASLPWASPVLVVAHSCVRSWWTAVKGGSPADVPSMWDEYTRRVSAGLHAADLVIAPTRAMLVALEHHYGSLSTTEVIPNGRTPVAPPAVERERLIFAAGRAWDEAKNLAALARVAPKLPWRVAIAGDTTSPDGGALALSPTVQWLGRVNARLVIDWMSRARIYALPARYEPFGLSPLEAALCGCALVLGDIPSLREVWGDAACYVAPADDDALAFTLQKLCAAPALRRSMAERATAHARTLTPERMGAAYMAAYARLRSVSPRMEDVACVS